MLLVSLNKVVEAPTFTSTCKYIYVPYVVVLKTTRADINEFHTTFPSPFTAISDSVVIGIFVVIGPLEIIFFFILAISKHS